MNEPAKQSDLGMTEPKPTSQTGVDGGDAAGSRADTLSPNDAIVQTYLNHLQQLIARCAVRSTSTKTWALSLTAATLVLVLAQERPIAALLAVIPLFVFGSLDAYALAVEREARDLFQTCVNRIKAGSLTHAHLFEFPTAKTPERGLATGRMKKTLEMAKLPAVWFFYTPLLVLLCFGFATSFFAAEA